MVLDFYFDCTLWGPFDSCQSLNMHLLRAELRYALDNKELKNTILASLSSLQPNHFQVPSRLNLSKKTYKKRTSCLLREQHITWTLKSF